MVPRGADVGGGGGAGAADGRIAAGATGCVGVSFASTEGGEGAGSTSSLLKASAGDADQAGRQTLFFSRTSASGRVIFAPWQGAHGRLDDRVLL